MAPEPQRAAQPHHLNPHIIPVERALIARAAAIEAEADEVTGVSESEVIIARARRAVAAEFRALAAELAYW